MADGFMNHGASCLRGEHHCHGTGGGVIRFQHGNRPLSSHSGNIFRGVLILQQLHANPPSDGFVTGLDFTVPRSHNLNKEYEAWTGLFNPLSL